MEKLLAFDLWGDYAHFRTYYTTSSPLSFAFPPKPTLCGLISAIIGLDKTDNDYLRHFQNGDCRVAICILSPLRKVRHTFNLINTKDQRGDHLFLPIKKPGHEPRTQIRTELVKDPKYRIYFQHRDPTIYQKLKDYLQQHLSYYTPSFGLSQLLINFSFISEVTVHEQRSDQWVMIDSLVPESFLIGKTSVKLEPTTEIFQVMTPMEMNPQRVVQRYERIFFERSGKAHAYRVKKYWETEDGKRIILF